MLIIVITLLGLLLLLFGCTTTKYVPIEFRTIEYRDKIVLDSIYNRDTVRIERRGDTVFNDVIRWRERFKIDTIRIHRIDSIPTIVEVDRIVEVNKLTWWQSFRLKGLNILILIIGLLLVYVFIRR